MVFLMAWYHFILEALFIFAYKKYSVNCNKMFIFTDWFIFPIIQKGSIRESKFFYGSILGSILMIFAELFLDSTRVEEEHWVFGVTFFKLRWLVPEPNDQSSTDSEPMLRLIWPFIIYPESVINISTLTEKLI